MTKIRKLEAGLVIAGFVVLLAVLVVSLARPADTRALNRLPTERPPFEPAGLFQDSYRAQLTGWLTDKLLLAGPARWANAAIETRIFHDAGSDLVIRGQEGWLFLNASIERLLPSRDMSRETAAVEGIVSALGVLEAQGIEARFALAPGKPAIYPQYLPGDLTELADRAAARRAHVMAAADHPGVIEIFANLRARAIAAPRLLYHPRDTHWNTYGAAVMAEAFMNSVAPQLWLEARLEPLGEPERVPDLVRLQGADTTAPMLRAHAVRPGVSVTFEQGTPEQGFTWRTRASGPAERLGTLVVIGDSFAFELSRLLGPFFDEVRFVPVGELEAHGAGGAFEDMDLVFIQIVERHLLRGAPHGPEGLGERLSYVLQP